jgi:hypothetical protein
MPFLLVDEAETSQSGAECLSRECGPCCLEPPGRPVHRSDKILLESHLNCSHGKPPSTCLHILIAIIVHIEGEDKETAMATL